MGVYDKGTYAQANKIWLEDVQSKNPEFLKRAQEAANDYVRIKLREDSFFDQIITPRSLTDSELDLQPNTDKPYKIVFKEPNSAAAVTLPFGTLPINQYILGERVPVGFDRIITPRFTKDIDELRTYRDIDIRQVLSDNALKDLSAEKDGKFIQAVNTLLGASGSTVAATGTIQYRTYSGGVSRQNVAESKKILTETPSRLRPATALVNQTTAIEFEKWERPEAGGDISQEILQNGWAERNWFGVRFIVTIKRDLIPDNEIYWFAAEDYLGRNFILNDVVMDVDRRLFLLEYTAYMVIGGVIANVAGIARSKFV